MLLTARCDAWLFGPYWRSQESQAACFAATAATATASDGRKKDGKHPAHLDHVSTPAPTIMNDAAQAP